MRRTVRIIALVLPVVGLAVLWASTERWSHEGTDWNVPIAGYDPRDLLRGHYIQFNYDWPVSEEEVEAAGYPTFGLCLKGNSPEIQSAWILTEPGESCEHLIRTGGEYHTDFAPTNGRLYIPQTQARNLENKLFDSELRATVQIRLRDDGYFNPQEITFRPLTEAEREEREARVTELPAALDTPTAE